MAISDGTIFLIIAQVGLYFVLYKHKIRLWRMVGSAGMITVGLSAVMIEDTVPALVFMGVSVMIGGIQLFKEVADLVKG